MKLTSSIAIGLILFSFHFAFAEVKVANIFGDNMVLQRDTPVNIFGTAEPGAKIVVSVRDQSVTAETDEQGRWLAVLQPLSVGQPFQVKVQGEENTVTLNNVVAGEVWICSGQSNMEWTVSRAGNPAEEIAAANWPLIRHVKIKNTTATSLQTEAENSGWQICSPETAGNFTAVGYYFGRHLHQDLDIPIGLINTSWGGTIVETWISGKSLKTLDDFRDRVNELENTSGPLKQKRADYQAAMNKWTAEYQNALRNAEKPEFWEANADDSQWKTHQLPNHWESQDLSGVDGVVWYRRDIEIPDQWAGKPAILALGKIDDQDKTYVNGKLVGQTGVWSSLRNYPIAADSMKAGTMSIAVQVTDTGGDGGFYGKPEVMQLAVEGQDPLSLAGEWKYRVGMNMSDLPKRPRNPDPRGPNHPTLLHNAMVNPIVPVTFRGAIWYQGESNASRAYQYRELFPLLIQDWRGKWDKEFPFYWVQLANFTAVQKEPGDSEWAELREAQSMTRTLPKSGQAVIIDIGEARDIHPKNKQEVGRRLALHALAKDYGKEVVCSGPTFKRMVREGKRIRLLFDNIHGGLVAQDGELKQFAIAGEDRVFVWADARIEDNEIVVSSRDVDNPVAVRYAWANNPEGCNLYNQEGLPASPFRTDDWPGVTKGKR